MHAKKADLGGEVLRAALEGAGIGSFSWDIDSGELAWSAEQERLFGFEPGSFPGTREAFLERIHPDDREAVVKAHGRAALEQAAFEVEFRVTLPDGRARWIGEKGRFLRPSEGKARRIAGVAMDVTGKKELETTLRESEDRYGRIVEREQKARKEAEQANRLKDEFLATVSHELRTPLTAILGWARILQTRQHDPVSVARAIETIERNAKGLAQIVEDILDVSRIITGKLRLSFGPVDVQHVLEAATEVVRPAAEAKGVTMAEPPSGPPCIVSGDPDRLQQVVWNLLSNAVKFTPKGGRVEASIERSSAFIRIRVTDTGQGIRRDFLPYLFNRFRQADSTTTRSHGGLGLGLAIVRHLVELHGGAVTASSEGEGLGSTFMVTLPIPEEPEEGSVRFPAPLVTYAGSYGPMALTALKILAVDDETDARELLAMVLEKEGGTVVAVASAAEALARIAEECPDVLVSDISMPEMDGYALIRKVRALPPEKGGRLPAVALTAYAREEDRRKALAAGFDVHVPKPLEPGKLIEVVARLGGRGRDSLM
jgi:PAS domain S-box-containing protein